MNIENSYIFNNRKYYVETDKVKNKTITYSIPLDQVDKYEKWNDELDEKSANFEKATDAITQKFSPKKARNIIVAGMFAGGIIMGGLSILAISKLFKLKGAKKYIISAITGTVGAVIGSLCGMVTTMSMYYTKQIKKWYYIKMPLPWICIII